MKGERGGDSGGRGAGWRRGGGSRDGEWSLGRKGPELGTDAGDVAWCDRCGRGGGAPSSLLEAMGSSLSVKSREKERRPRCVDGDPKVRGPFRGQFW